ncbi:MAG: hypothetical protein KatS3mg060_0370 [Dehalococcoidia bacterium]|nr:MAG: hypothetical protein KatS3mg060_0370 [Dehalococcoidia bacterium]
MARLLARLVSIVTLLVVGCAPGTAPTPQTGGQQPPAERRAADQTVRFAVAAIPSSASPESTSAQNYLFNAQFDAMAHLDAKFNLNPWVAMRWEFLPNDNAWRFFLRNDLTFSNGDKLTAEDVAFTARLIANQTPPLPQKAVLAKLVDARVVDPYTVDLITSERDASVLYGMPYFLVFPKAYYEQVGKDQFGVKPIGSGPYELVEFRTNDTLVYRLRPNYVHPIRRPVATELRWKAVPDAAAIYNGIRTGEVDGAFSGLTVEQAELAKRDNLYLATVSPVTPRDQHR